VALIFSSNSHSRLGTLLGLWWTTSCTSHIGVIQSIEASFVASAVGGLRVAAHGHNVMVAPSDMFVQKSHNVMMQSFLRYVTRQAVHVVRDVTIGVVV